MGQMMCKYCKKPGKFDPISRKVMCYQHRKVAFQSRELIRSIAMVHVEDEYKILGQRV